MRPSGTVSFRKQICFFFVGVALVGITVFVCLPVGRWMGSHSPAGDDDRLPIRAKPAAWLPVAEDFESSSFEPTRILLDDSEVIHVQIGTRHRAYPVDSLFRKEPVLHDVVGGCGVVICSGELPRAWLLPPDAHLVTGAMSETGDTPWCIELGGRQFTSFDSEWPLQELPCALMTWADFQAEHPQGTVCGNCELRGRGLSGIVCQIPGVPTPPVHSVADVELEPSTPVIGITVGDHHRAYVTRALGRIDRHVINDQLTDRGVTVTYCDRTNCVRVFEQPAGQEPLNVAVYGLINGKMWLEFEGVAMLQESPDAPLVDLRFERTTWGDWKATYPDTDIYTGKSSDSGSAD